MKLVIDTNVIVSAVLIEGSKPNKLLNIWRAGDFELVICVELLEEISEVLNRDKIKKRYGLKQSEIDGLLQEMLDGAMWVELGEYRDIIFGCRDKKDENLLGLRKASAADFVVSGDHDLEEFEKVISVTKILENLQLT